MIAFVNAFLSYGVLMLILLAVGAAGMALGIRLRKNKQAKDGAAEAVEAEQSR